MDGQLSIFDFPEFLPDGKIKRRAEIVKENDGDTISPAQEYYIETGRTDYWQSSQNRPYIKSYPCSDCLDYDNGCPHGIDPVKVNCNKMRSIALEQLKSEKFKPGDWVESDSLGKELTFDEIANSVGKLIIMDMSTVSHAWYKVVQVENIVEHEGARRLVYYDGHHQRGYVNERWFTGEWKSAIQSRAWNIKL